MKKPLSLKIDEVAHATLKKEANEKGLKFYSYLEKLLEDKAKRLEKSNEQQS